MSNPTLTKGNGVPTNLSNTNFRSSSSLILTLYNAEEEASNKTANFSDYPFPGKNSENHIVYDLLGAVRRFTVRGRATTDDVASLSNFALDLFDLINGRQGNTGNNQIGYIYTPVFFTPASSLTVFVEDISISYKNGDPSELYYSISLVEASATKSA